MSDLHRKLRVMLAIRLLVAVSIAVPYYLYRLSLGENPEVAAALSLLERGVLLPLLAGASVQTLLYIALLGPLDQRPKAHAYLQFVGDLLLVTIMFSRLGNAAVGFSILYFVVIVVASVLLRRAAGFVIANLAFVLYAFIVLLPFVPGAMSVAKWIPVLGSPAEPLLTGFPLVYNLTMHLVGFYAVALFTSYLGKDVTRVEEQLRAKHRDLATLEVAHQDIVQSISSGLVTTDLGGLVTSVNRSGEEILGRSAEDLVGLHVSRSGLFNHAAWHEQVRLAEDGTLRTELEAQRGDEFAHLSFSLSPLRDAEGRRRGYILVLEDRTEQHKMQEELRIKDRLAAVGQMAAGLAHEVGNPLAAISGSVQVLASSFKGSESQRKLLEITLKESRRLDRTVKDFLRLASSREHSPIEHDIGALLLEDVELLRNSNDVRSEHEIVADIESARVIADPDQISQIFWNLTRNALKAMPSGGTLTLRGRRRKGIYRVELIDTGNGMTEEEKTKLFQPFKSFFDDGAGIGMAIVYRIVEEHGGRIHVDSTLGEGTVIRIDLPLDGRPEEDLPEFVQGGEDEADEPDPAPDGAGPPRGVAALFLGGAA